MTQFSSLAKSRLTRELGNSDTSVLFTGTLRRAAINEGQEQFADLTECFLKRATLAINGGVAEYDLALTGTVSSGADFVRLTTESVEFRYTDASSNITVLAGEDLPRRDIPWLDRYRPGWQLSTTASTTQQLPDCYYVRRDGASYYLGFNPVPSSGSSASMTALVPYVARPEPMVNASDEPFTVSSIGRPRTDLRVYHQALVHYAASQLEKLRRDDAASDRQYQLFLGWVGRYLQATRVRGGWQTLTAARSYFSKRTDVQGEDPRK